MSNSVFEINLEKRARGRSTSTFFTGKSWADRKIVLTGQWLQYFQERQMKGAVLIAASLIKVLPPEEADGRLFAFEIDTGEEKLVFNADSEVTREKCVQIFKLAALRADWITPEEEKEMKNRKTLATVTTHDTDFYVFESVELIMKKEALQKTKQELELKSLQYQQENEWLQRAGSLIEIDTLNETKKFTWLIGSEPINFESGQKIGNVITIGINYILSFEILLSTIINVKNNSTNLETGSNPDWRSVIRFTANNDNVDSIGARNPAIFVYPDSRGLHVRMSGNSSTNSGINQTADLPLNIWTTVTVKVIQNLCTVEFNGDEICSESIDRSDTNLIYPMDCQCFVSDSFHLPADGQIRFVRILNL